MRPTIEQAYQSRDFETAKAQKACTKQGQEIEMGTLTDRLTDKQIGQQMDSAEGGSSGEVNSTVYSPRKTRSGRVR